MLDPTQSSVHFEDLSSFFLTKERIFDKLDVEIIGDNDPQHRDEKAEVGHLQIEEWKEDHKITENAEPHAEKKMVNDYYEQKRPKFLENNLNSFLKDAQNKDEDLHDFQSNSKISYETKIICSESESFLQEFDDFLIANREKPYVDLANNDYVCNDIVLEQIGCRTKSKDTSFKNYKGEDSNISKNWGKNSKYHESIKSEENSFK